MGRRTALLPLAVTLVLAAPAAAQGAEAPTAAGLTDTARGLMPRYDGETKPLLLEEERTRVRAAAHLLAAATILGPESTYALWWRAQAEMLLAENLRHRGDAGAADARLDTALECLDRALELDPTSHWSLYARAKALTDRRAYGRALAAYAEAIDRANAAAGAAPDDTARTDALFVRFKARQWRCEVLMRALDFATARDEWRSFYADNGNNQWDLGYSLAESYLRERDYAGARATYERVLETPDFVPYSSTHEQLGYLAGLQGRTADAVRRLETALEHELQPSMYARLWLWILCAPEDRERYEADLAGLLEHPPQNVTAWDVTLGRACLGAGTDDELLAAAEAELARRTEAAEVDGDLRCEVWFYVGLRRETRAGGDAAGLRAALEAYRRALAEDPIAFKWEWEYARNGLARLAAALGLAAAPGFTLDGATFAADPAAPLVHVTGAPRGAVLRAGRHAVGADAARAGVEALAGPCAPGELVQVALRDEAGELALVRVVVDAR